MVEYRGRTDPKYTGRLVASMSTKIYPPCRQCNVIVRPTDLKYNGCDEDGNLYECYHCSCCGHRFTISYEGPDDSYDWYYVTESDNRKTADRGVRRLSFRGMSLTKGLLRR